LTSSGNIRGGLLWTLMSRFGAQGLQLVFGIALARILGPREFGLVGMLLVFSGFAQLLSDTGLGTALIYKEDLDEDDKSTVFWIQIVASAALSAAFFLLSGFMATFFKAPELATIAKVVSPVFLLQALGQVQSSLLRRAFQFRLLSMATFVSTVLSGAVAITFAVLGLGVWALVSQMLALPAVMSAICWWGCEWKPKAVFSKRSARHLGSYGAYLLGHNCINYWLRNGDNLIIGRFLGTIDLGLYTRAYSLMLLPISNVSTVFGQVMFPALARAQGDPAQFARLYLRALRLIAFMTFPVMAGVALLSRQIVLILFGSKWGAMIPILQILSIVGLVQSIIFPVGWVYTALGKTKEQFFLSVFLIFAFILAMAIGIRGGVLGVTIWYAVWAALASALNLIVIDRFLTIEIQQTFIELARISLVTVMMSGAVWTMNEAVIGRLPLMASALLDAVVGAGVYLLGCIVVKEPVLQEALSFVRRREIALVSARPPAS
jgi:O-antigen/teichoic acid export membrane protein